jgi:hypothetical protein
VPSALDQGEDLVAPGGGLDAQGAAGDQVVEPVGVAGQAEEPVLLRDEFRFGAVLGALSVDQFVFGVELLAADAVEALVFLAAGVAGGGAPPPPALNADAVPGALRCPRPRRRARS